MADESLRLRALRLLGTVDLTSAQLALWVGVDQSHASHTLRHLARTGIVARERVGMRAGTRDPFRYRLAVPVVWKDRIDIPCH